MKSRGDKPDALEAMAPGVFHGWGSYNAAPKEADAGFLSRK